MTFAKQTVQRLEQRDPVARVPRAVPGEPGLFIVDATWGKVQPLQLPGGVPTVGELEVIEHLESGGLLIDTRQPEHVAHGTIPGALPIRHQNIVDGLGALSPAGPVVLFCNGPQCAATVMAVEALLAADWDPSQLRYYRGGVHDWVTLGFPLVDAPTET